MPNEETYAEKLQRVYALKESEGVDDLDAFALDAILERLHSLEHQSDMQLFVLKLFLAQFGGEDKRITVPGELIRELGDGPQEATHVMRDAVAENGDLTFYLKPCDHADHEAAGVM